MCVCVCACSSFKVVDGEDVLHSCMPFLTILWFKPFVFLIFFSHTWLCRFSFDENENEEINCCYNYYFMVIVKNPFTFRSIKLWVL